MADVNRNPDDGRRPDRGPPNEKPRGRGSRQGDPDADSVLPAREFGAGGEIDDGPGVSGGGARPGKPS